MKDNTDLISFGRHWCWLPQPSAGPASSMQLYL